MGREPEASGPADPVTGHVPGEVAGGGGRNGAGAGSREQAWAGEREGAGSREVRQVGDVGVLVGCDGPEDALRVAAGLRALGAPGGPLAPSGVVDVVPAARTVLVTGRAGELVPARVAEALAGGALAAGLPVGVALAAGISGGRSPAAVRPERTGAGDGPAGSAAVLTCGVHFDGPDLDATAQLLGRSREALVAHLAGVAWTVAFCGFAPGFGYCVGGGLDVPRLDRPRTRVPARSVGLAGPYAGFYPRESPGGWRLVGRLADDVPVLFDPDRDPPALLAPGTRLRLEAR